MDSHSCSLEIGEVGESASLGRWRHVVGQDGGAEASALGVERMMTAALLWADFDVKFLLSMNVIRALYERPYSRRTTMLKDTVAFKLPMPLDRGLRSGNLGFPSLAETG